MLGLPSEKQNKIYNLLTNMRELKDDDKSCFEDYLPEAWELLGLKSNKSLVSFEALLIEAVMNIRKGCQRINMINTEKPYKNVMRIF